MYFTVDSLVRERQKNVFFSANTRGHVLLCIIKLVVASLAAPDQLSKGVVLSNEKDRSCQISSSQSYFVLFKHKHELLTMPVIRARGLVWSLMGLKLSHLDRSLFRVTSVAISSLAFTEQPVLHKPQMVGWFGEKLIKVMYYFTNVQMCYSNDIIMND